MTNEDLIQNGSRNMVVGSSTVTKWIRHFVCAATFSEIAMRDKLGMMHLQLKAGMVGTRNPD